MKKIIFISLLGTFIFFTCTSKSKKLEKSVTQVAQIDILKSLHDFGNIELNSINRGFFIIKNTGDINLSYFHIITSCSCTKIDNNKYHYLEPNKVDTIWFDFDSKEIAEGEINQTVRVISNTQPDMLRFEFCGILN